jgi:hypothetical protein
MPIQGRRDGGGKLYVFNAEAQRTQRKAETQNRFLCGYLCVLCASELSGYSLHRRLL